MNKKRIYFLSSGILLLIIGWYIFSPSGNNKEGIKVKVKKGEFLITVTSTGELQARNSENIMGPPGLQAAGIWQVKITEIVPEGTRVKEGGHVATLDRSDISNKLKDLESELSRTQSLFIKTQLDTTLDLRTARDELINLKYGYEEKKLVLDQSKYEPPATIRQAELDLDKADRSYKQAIKNYVVKEDQSKAKMEDVASTLEQQTRKHQTILDLVDQFEIKTPKPGMVVYKREWDGKKVSVGSTISPWDPTVATLPDLSSMISLTYISEIDISKVKTDQVVQVGVDALNEKKYTGKVISVANVGEQLKNTDAKVFEVKILINEKDSTLRPAMTTSNSILTAKIPNALSIPLECIHNEKGKTYVFKQKGYSFIKQEIKTGRTNENEAVVEKGLNENDEVYLSVPDNSDKTEITSL